jgi:hypothetical protein
MEEVEEGEEDFSFFFFALFGDMVRDAADVTVEEEEPRAPEAAAAAILLSSLEAPIMSTRASIIVPLWSNICFFK